MKLKKEIKHIFFRNTFIVFLPVLLSFLLVFFVTYYSQMESIKKNIETKCDYNTTQTLDRYNVVMSEINNQISEFVSTNDFGYFFYEKNIYSENSETFRKTVDLFNKNTTNFSVSSSFIRNIALYCVNNDFLIFGKQGNMYSNERDTVISYIESFKKENKDTCLYTKVYKDQNKRLYVLQKLFYNTDYVGVIIYSIDCEPFFERIVSDSDNLISIVLTQNNAGKLEYEFNPLLNNSKNLIIKKSLDGVTAECIYDYSESIAMNNIFSIRLWIVIIICFFVLIVITFFVSVKIYVPFKTINKILDAPSSSEETKKGRDYDFISLKVKNAVGAKFMLENQLSENLENLKKMEAMALQTQINPHFLYNTLHVISAYSTTLTEYDNNVTQMLENLSKMLKYTFSTKSFTTTVSEELSYLKIYCDFQKERFYEKFDIFFEIDNSLLEKKVLKLMFQPVFENAITHGIRCADKKCHIILKGYTENETMIFDIINNGIPIDDNASKNINEYLLSGEIREDEHIGLSNINKRIKIIFGPEYGVSIFRNENNETVTKIILPL